MDFARYSICHVYFILATRCANDCHSRSTRAHHDLATYSDSLIAAVWIPLRRLGSRSKTTLEIFARPITAIASNPPTKHRESSELIQSVENTNEKNPR